MKKILTILFLTTFLFNKSFACLNGEQLFLKNRTIIYIDREEKIPTGHDFNKINFSQEIKELDSLYQSTQDLDYLSDTGLLLILQGKYEKAIKLYLEIEKIEPNRYSTASNIGTAYELIGQNENALKWINKSVEINSESHYNSEWIHVNILEAKIKGEEFITTESLLNTDFGIDSIPSSKMNEKELKDLSIALYYQLNERISFVKPKEAIVAQLLFDLGNIEFLRGNFEDAKNDYIEAEKYGFTNQLLLIRKEEAIRLNRQPKVINKEVTPEEGKRNYLLWKLCIFLVVMLVSLLFWKPMKRNN